MLKTGKHADYFCYVHESPEVLTVQMHGLGVGVRGLDDCTTHSGGLRESS